MDASGNPAFNDKAISRFQTIDSKDTMTVSGSLFKTAVAFLFLIAAGIAGWNYFPNISESIQWLWIGGASLFTLILGLVAAFRPNPIVILGYALAEGFLLGFFSRMFETAYEGIVVQAILLTVATTLGMLILFATGLVKVTEKFRSVLLIATFGVLIYILFEFIISLFSPGFASFVSTGAFGITIAAVIVLIAALNLLLDFDFIRRGSQQGLPKKTEWYAAFGLMVTLIWLYVSILRLLAASRR